MTGTLREMQTLHDACAAVGLSSTNARPLHKHATSVWLLPEPDVVIRLSRPGDDHARIARSVAITRWLQKREFPAVEPVAVDQPIKIGTACVTFWRHYPQDHRGTPHAAHLGRLLRRLHRLPTPPVELHPYQPLTHLAAALQQEAPISADDRAWLDERRQEVLHAYADIESELGVGFIHGDAYPGNTIWDGEVVRLVDWDEIALGPRELDLVNTHQGARIGRPKAERDAFSEAYGWDVTVWREFPVLRGMRDLHSLAAYFDLAAAGDRAATDELHHRITTLRVGDGTARWHVR